MVRKCGIAGGVVGTVMVTLIAGWNSVPTTAAQMLKVGSAVRPSSSRPASPAVRLARISPAIPIYQGATYEPEQSKADLAEIRSRYGPKAEVWTLKTDDSFPQVWHFYVLYLAQYRAWKPISSYPRPDAKWRHLNLDLNHIMRDPFIPGDSLEKASNEVYLQIAEQERPTTVIRYIVVPKPEATAQASTSSSSTSARTAKR